MLNIALVAAGGAIGSVLRYLVGLAAARSLGPAFPFGTLTVNLVGGFLIGLVAGVFAIRAEAPQELRVFLITGCLGGFTTFSAFSLETVVLAQSTSLAKATAYVLLSVGLAVLAAAAGFSLTRA